MTRTRPAARPRRSMEAKYVKRRQRGLAVLIAAIILIVGSVVYIGVQLSESGDYRGDGNGESKLVEVQEGITVSELGPQLVDLGVVKSADAFQAAAYANPAASSIQPGFYRLEEKMSAQAAVAALVDPANQVDMLDIPGGATLLDTAVVGGDTRRGIFSMISEVSCAENTEECVSTEELEQVAATADPVELGVPDWALDAVRARGEEPNRLEGLLRPGRYVVDPHQSAQEILTTVITRSAEFYNSTDIESRAQAIGLANGYELLTAASLIEREAPAGDFDRVARVILNRLHGTADSEPMRLQFDSTVNYSLHEQEVATTDEDRDRVTPWNTYAMEGLPETPIAAPSDEAINAMENPAEGDWLYFVTINQEGETVFSTTLEEHEAAVVQAQENGVLDSNR